jgi:hypothetical protein
MSVAIAEPPKRSTPSKPPKPAKSSSAKSSSAKSKHSADALSADEETSDTKAAARRSERIDRKYEDETPVTERLCALREIVDDMANGDRESEYKRLKSAMKLKRKTAKALAYIEENGCGVPVGLGARLFKKAQIQHDEQYATDKKFYLSRSTAVVINRLVSSMLEKMLRGAAGFMCLEDRAMLDAARVKEAAIASGLVQRSYMLGFGKELNHQQIELALREDRLKETAFSTALKAEKKERADERAAAKAEKEAASDDSDAVKAAKLAAKTAMDEAKRLADQAKLAVKAAKLAAKKHKE